MLPGEAVLPPADICHRPNTYPQRVTELLTNVVYYLKIKLHLIKIINFEVNGQTVGTFISTVIFEKYKIKTKCICKNGFINIRLTAW